MTHLPPTDQDLISRIQQTKDPHWFGMLYDRYAKKVFNKCLLFVKDSSEAEDLTHDIFVKVYLNLHKFRGQSQFATWLYAIAYHFCISHLRQRKEFVPMPDYDSIPVSEEVSDEEFLSARVVHLEWALQDIAPEERMILLMRYQDDMSIKEIQEALQLGESAVKMRLLRAKNRAAEQCEKYKISLP